MSAKPQRILIYRIGQIGDTIVSLPALWAIRRHLPQAHLTLFSDSHSQNHVMSARSVLPECGLFDQWLSYPANVNGSSARDMIGVLPELRRQRFDTLVYLAPRIRSARQIQRDLLFFRMAGIRRFIGHQGFAPLPPRAEGPLPSIEHEADHLLRRIALSGIPVPAAGEGEINLALTEAERCTADDWLESQLPLDSVPIVGIGPGSKWPSKCWPEIYYAELGRKLIDQFGIYPVVFGGPEDADIAKRLTQTWGRGSVAAGVFNLRQAAAALRRCTFYLGNDTGTMHLAAAEGTPCVAIFSAQDWPGRWYPYGANHTVLRHSVSCEGCMLAVCTVEGLRCLRGLGVDEVLEACRKKLEIWSPHSSL